MGGLRMSVSLLFVLVTWISVILCPTWAQDGGRELYFPDYYFFAWKRLMNYTIISVPVKDLDECEYRCYMNANCVSLNIKNKDPHNGTHECELNNSTHLEDDGVLTDSKLYYYRGAENKCGKNRLKCKNNSTCQSGFTQKGYRCSCTTEFEGEHCDNDINECDRGSHNCHSNATCNNTEGGYNCSCKEGYTGDGQNCTDVDECAQGHPCDTVANSECNNTDGSYNCHCKDGFVKNGGKCEVDRCQKYDTFNTSDRNLANADQSHSTDCSSFQEGWYRFIRAAGTRLPTQCPQIQSQRHSVWLNVTHNKLPHKGEGVKAGIKVCLPYPQSSSGCCKHDFTISVQNCSSYLVYWLHKIPSCTYQYYGTN